jgi:tetratricopeptide (TPR) repeat protein
LEEGVSGASRYGEEAAQSMADSYVSVGKLLFEKRQLQAMERALKLSLQTRATPAALNVLGTLAYDAGRTTVAMEHWGRSLALEDEQPHIHSLVGKALVDNQVDAAAARFHLERAVRQDPGLAPQLDPWLTRARALSRGQ